MSKKSILMCILSVLLAAYCCFAVPYTQRMAEQAHVKKLEVSLTDPTSRFVNVSDVILECRLDPDTVSRCLRRTFSLRELEARLMASDKLQNANVTMGADGTVRVVVEPMIPVARVFDSNRPDSYYINAQGKAISAELRYHIDVPVLVGAFDSVHPAARLLPLLDRIAGDPRLSSLVATVTQEPDGNIILVPTIVGHVINFGDTADVDEKFRRLRAFYRHVAPTMGWQKYDTVAVKWHDRIVATRRNKEIKPIPLPTEEEASGILDFDNNELLPDDTGTGTGAAT